MRLLLLFFLLARGVDDPSFTATAQFDDVWGPSCITALETGLGRLEGVLSANVKGPRAPEKFYFDLKMKESAALTPSTILKLQKGTPLEDYPLVGLVYAGMAGTVEKGTDGLRFTARGSKQRYALKSAPALDALLAAGKLNVVLGGKVTQPEKGDPQIEVSEALEIK